WPGRALARRSGTARWRSRPGRGWPARPNAPAPSPPASPPRSAARRWAAFLQDPWLIPFQAAAPPDIDVRDQHSDDEKDHLDQAEDAELVEGDRPGIQENDLDAEHEQQHSAQEVHDRQTAPS